MNANEAVSLMGNHNRPDHYAVRSWSNGLEILRTMTDEEIDAAYTRDGGTE